MSNEGCTCKPVTYDDLVEGKRPGQWDCAVHGYLATRRRLYETVFEERVRKAYESQLAARR